MIRRFRSLRGWIIGVAAVSIIVIIYVPVVQQILPQDKADYHPHESIKVMGKHMYSEGRQGELNLLETKFLDFTPDFSNVKTGDKPLIPQIVHQVWDTTDIQGLFHKWVKLWPNINPEFEYWLWTLEDARALIKAHFPDYLTLFDSYPSVIHKADAMRYFILYHYGGVYMDLDMQPLRPISNWTYSYNCVLSQESYEHPYVVRGETNPNIVNGVMLCKAKHPFFLKAIKSLGHYANRFFGDFLHATGPKFLNAVFEQYKNESHNTAEDNITVVPPKYFLPTFDRSESEVISTKCFPTRVRELAIEGQTLCRELLARRYKNEPGPEAYTDHHWVHANMFDKEWKKMNTLPIHELVPKVKSPII